MTTAPTIDLAAVKPRQQATWASGDYAEIATLIVPVAERLVDAADLRAGSRVLDVARGSGTQRSPPPGCGCVVAGIDYVPSSARAGRARAAAERLETELLDGDAEALRSRMRRSMRPCRCSARCSLPTIDRTAAELVRVTRPGGRSRSRAGRPTASSARCSARSRVRAPAGRSRLTDAVGYRGASR